VTFKQAQELGGHVRKGERGSLVVYANRITKTETNEAGEDTEREIPFMKGYTVFNVEQVEGLPAHYYGQPVNPLPVSERIEAADAFMTATGAAIHHGGNSAYYAPARDIIQLSPCEAFKDKESYYATARWPTRRCTSIARKVRRYWWIAKLLTARTSSTQIMCKLQRDAG
jgi:antirestriction protein ArdC